MSDNARVGVFVCECGGRVAGALDVAALAQHARELAGVAWAGQAGYWCLPGSIARMRSVVAEQHLDRVVIAGCTPRTHDALFRRALDSVGADSTFIRVTNLRDLCARPHADDVSAAMTKACDQIAMAVAELATREPSAPRVAHITPHAVVIGGGIAGMTAALAISEANIPVTLIEREAELGGHAHTQIDERIAAVRTQHAQRIRVLTNTAVQNVRGTVGQYRVVLNNGETIDAGVIIVAIGAKSKLQVPDSKFSKIAFLLCDLSPAQGQTCMHNCCLDAVQQAIDIKQAQPDSETTILFRELYTAGGRYDESIWQAQQAGVKFVRYPAGQVPQAIDGEITTYDELTDRNVRVACDQLLSAQPMAPQADAAYLAQALHLPIDSSGFIADARIRLRPSDRVERGIYVCGAAHFPCDADRAIFQAYDVAARAVRHIQRGEIVSGAPAAIIDATRCNGCGDCTRACPFAAVELIGRPGEARLAVIDSLLCTGCGNCVSACPVKAAQVSSSTDVQIEAQIRAALGRDGKDQRVLVFACEWSGYSAAEIAGAQGLAHPANTRLIRINCTGRLQPGLLLKALEMGAAGVMVLGCAPGVCHYEQGNEHAAAVFEQASGLGQLMGLGNRIGLKWIPPDDGAAFVAAVEEFCNGL